MNRITYQTLLEIIEDYEYLIAVGAITEEEIPFLEYLEDAIHNLKRFI